MRGGGGPSGTGTRRMEGGGDGGGCFTAAVSLLLRVGILMRSVNECWQRRGCAAVEKQPPCPCRTAAAAPHSLFHLTPGFTRNMCASFFLSQIFHFFFFVSHVHLLVMYFLFFPPTQGICFCGPLIATLYSSLSCRAFNAVFRGLYSAVANI